MDKTLITIPSKTRVCVTRYKRGIVQHKKNYLDASEVIPFDIIKIDKKSSPIHHTGKQNLLVLNVTVGDKGHTITLECVKQPTFYLKYQDHIDLYKESQSGEEVEVYPNIELHVYGEKGKIVAVSRSQPRQASICHACGSLVGLKDECLYLHIRSQSNNVFKFFSSNYQHWGSRPSNDAKLKIHLHPDQCGTGSQIIKQIVAKEIFYGP